MEYIYNEWKKLLDNFQQCVEKDLEEIHAQKSEVQQIKTDIFSRLEKGHPENWCPIEQDYYVDGKAFKASELRPYRVCLSNGAVGRNLGEILNIQGVYGREIPGGAAQMLRMRLNPEKELKSLTIRTLSNDVVIGLMAVTLQ